MDHNFTGDEQWLWCINFTRVTDLVSDYQLRKIFNLTDFIYDLKEIIFTRLAIKLALNLLSDRLHFTGLCNNW